MIWPLNTVVFAKAAIMATYLMPIAAIIEIIVSQRLIFIPLIGFFVVLYLWNLKGSDGRKIFSVEKLERVGPLYYFPLRLADELRQ